MSIFRTAFDDQPDLATLSPAARRVLATAAALFFERGAVDTSVRDLTSACGLTPGALYNHFSSKDELLYTLVRHGQDRIGRRLDDAVRDTGSDALQRFRAFVFAYVSGHVEQPHLAQMVRREYLHLSSERYAEIINRRRTIRRQLAELLVDGHDSGHFHLIGGSAGAIGQALMILDMCSRTSDWFDPSGKDDPTSIAQRYVEAALRLVGVTAGAPA